MTNSRLIVCIVAFIAPIFLVSALTEFEPLQIDIEYTANSVAFTFHTIPKERSAPVNWFEVYELGLTNSLSGVNVLWSVRGISPSNRVTRIEYGLVPPGFQQQAPMNDPAPALIYGARYHVAAQGDQVGKTNFIFESRRPSVENP